MFKFHRIAASALGLIACLAGGSAFAQDSLATYDLSGVTFRDGASASGSFVIDLTRDALLSWDIHLTAGRFLGALVPAQTFDNSLAGASAQAALMGPAGHDLVFFSDTSGKDFLNLYFTSSLLGSPGFAGLGPALTLDSLVTRGGLVVTALSNRGTPGATLTASSVPEPSGVVLLAVGALVVGTTLKRRG